MKLLSAILVSALAVTATMVRADTILFDDSGSPLSVTQTGNSRLVTDSNGNQFGTSNFAPCVGQLCSVVVFGLTTPPNFGSGVSLYIQEPGTNLISDVVIGANPALPDSYTLTFASFDNPTFTCPAYGCFTVENGSVQTLYTVAWGDGSTDTIEFQSPVPEPASLLLLATGLAGMFSLRRRMRS